MTGSLPNRTGTRKGLSRAQFVDRGKRGKLVLRVTDD
jgi:hypothetical protein